MAYGSETIGCMCICSCYFCHLKEICFISQWLLPKSCHLSISLFQNVFICKSMVNRLRLVADNRRMVLSISNLNCSLTYQKNSSRLKNFSFEERWFINWANIRTNRSSTWNFPTTNREGLLYDLRESPKLEELIFNYFLKAIN